MMPHTVRHLSLHRIATTELRVVADVESGVLPVIQAEDTVIRRYADVPPGWPHRWVTLFVLRDLEPLTRQLGAAGSSAAGGSQSSLPPGGLAGLNDRPVVNVYDLADLSRCHVFVNRESMTRAGYWGRPLAIEGLLAHEHAHPLAENETARASRRWQVEADIAMPASSHPQAVNRRRQLAHQIGLLADKLCLYAPRELFANERAIRSGFAEALLDLNRCNMEVASRSVSGREGLCRQLRQEESLGRLSSAAAGILLLVADLSGYLELALEVAPFYRGGREAEGRELDATLATILAQLEPRAAAAYGALRQQYLALRPEFAPPAFREWGEGVLAILTQALAGAGADVRFRWRTHGES